MNNLLVFGAGYCASACAARSRQYFTGVQGTTRSAARMEALGSSGILPLQFDGKLSWKLGAAIDQASHLLVSTAPGNNGDPVLEVCGRAIAKSRALKWVCYLSTVGVYGDYQGAWVSEESRCRPVSARSIERVAAEKAWREFTAGMKIPLAIFRLSGIYGPGRNAFINIANGTSRRLVKPGQVFNRIHRDDIAAAFALASASLQSGVFNITDDEPAPPQDVVSLAHTVAGIAPPEETDFATAQLSVMARSFYGENKRVSNHKSKSVLGMGYAWPNYRDALAKMWETDAWR